MSEKVELLLFSGFVLSELETLGITQEDFGDKVACYTLKNRGMVIDKIEAVHWEDAKKVFEEKGLNIDEYFDPAEFTLYWDGANWVIEDLDEE